MTFVFYQTKQKRYLDDVKNALCLIGNDALKNISNACVSTVYDAYLFVYLKQIKHKTIYFRHIRLQ